MQRLSNSDTIKREACSDSSDSKGIFPRASSALQYYLTVETISQRQAVIGLSCGRPTFRQGFLAPPPKRFPTLTTSSPSQFFTNRHLFHRPSCFSCTHGIPPPSFSFLGRRLNLRLVRTRGHRTTLPSLGHAGCASSQVFVPISSLAFGGSSSIHNHTAILEQPSPCLVISTR